MRTRIAIAAAVLAAGAPSYAQVDVAALLEEARRLYDEVEYERAEVVFGKVAKSEAATPAQKVEALAGQAFSLVALGRDAKAVDA